MAQLIVFTRMEPNEIIYVNPALIRYVSAHYSEKGSLIHFDHENSVAVVEAPHAVANSINEAKRG